MLLLGKGEELFDEGQITVQLPQLKQPLTSNFPNLRILDNNLGSILSSIIYWGAIYTTLRISCQEEETVYFFYTLYFRGSAMKKRLRTRLTISFATIILVVGLIAAFAGIHFT